MSFLVGSAPDLHPSCVSSPRIAQFALLASNFKDAIRATIPTRFFEADSYRRVIGLCEKIVGGPFLGRSRAFHCKSRGTCLRSTGALLKYAFPFFLRSYSHPCEHANASSARGGPPRRVVLQKCIFSPRSRGEKSSQLVRLPLGLPRYSVVFW